MDKFIPCYRCGHQVLVIARNCDKCGYEIQMMDIFTHEMTQSEEKGSQTKQKKTKKLRADKRNLKFLARFQGRIYKFKHLIKWYIGGLIVILIIIYLEIVNGYFF
tara:strand:- start:3677 stop:3991 length:315 start_codon:yes stop_codon:yes gene_type:complete